MGRVTIPACWGLHLSHSVKVGVKIAMTTEELCYMVVNLTVLAVNPFLQVPYEPCGPSVSILPIPSTLSVLWLQALPHPFQLHIFCQRNAFALEPTGVLEYNNNKNNNNNKSLQISRQYPRYGQIMELTNSSMGETLLNKMSQKKNQLKRTSL